MKAPAEQGCFPTGKHYPGIAHLLNVTVVGLAPELAADLPLASLPIVAIDTETTGRDFTNDRIVEIAAVLWEDGAVIARHGWLVNPERPIPSEATQVHHITDDMVRDAPRFSDLIPELVELTRGHVPLAYNAEFDRNFIHREFSRASLGELSLPPLLRHDVHWIDPLVWARLVQQSEKSRALGDVATRLGIPLTQAHRATDDAEAAVRVMAALAADSRVPKQYGAFLKEQQRLLRLQQEERAYWRQNR